MSTTGSREQPPVRMIMQVHDELVFEVAEDQLDVCTTLCERMGAAAELAALLVPLGRGALIFFQSGTCPGRRSKRRLATGTRRTFYWGLALLFADAEKVDELRAPRRARGPRQLAIAREAVDSAALAGVGATGEGDFPALVRGTLGDAGGADEERGAPIVRPRRFTVR
jgi:hypothetical protein